LLEAVIVLRGDLTGRRGGDRSEAHGAPPV